jgi:hypothetical protein
MRIISIAAIAAMAMSSSAYANSFTNGDFETGDASGWTQGGGFRGGISNPSLNPGALLPGDGGVRSSIIVSGTVDPNVGAALGSTVYGGKYSFRVEDTTYGGYASVIQQQVKNYTDPDIFFAWKSVLLGAHGPTDAATMIITLTDLTTSTELIRREYNAASGGSGVDPRFAFDGSNYYTPQWQIEQLTLSAGSLGHDFLLSVLASDCQPTGHWGYVYLDGFGAVAPPPGGGVPEPAAWAMMLAGFGVIGGALRRREKVAVSFA